MKYISKHRLQIPSLTEPLEYREYTIGEEKEIVQIDIEDGEEEKYFKVKKLVKSCITSDVDFSKISPNEIWYIFIHMRIKSVDNIGYASVTCPKCFENINDELIELSELKSLKENDLSGEDLTHLNSKINSLNKKVQEYYNKIRSDIEINLEDVKIITDKNHKNIIDLGDNLKIEMNYNIDYSLDIDEYPDVKIIASCIDTIYEGEVIINDLNINQKIEILKGLPIRYGKKLEQFLITQPKIEYKGNTECGNCSNVYEYNLTSINDFF